MPWLTVFNHQLLEPLIKRRVESLQVLPPYARNAFAQGVTEERTDLQTYHPVVHLHNVRLSR